MKNLQDDIANLIHDYPIDEIRKELQRHEQMIKVQKIKETMKEIVSLVEYNLPEKADAVLNNLDKIHQGLLNAGKERYG